MAWHKFTIAWKGLDVAAACDGEKVLAAKLVSPVTHLMPRGIEIRFARSDNDVPFIVGPLPGALIRKLAIWDL